MANLTNYERETVILFNEAEGMAIVNTANSALSRRLAELAESRPGEVIFKKSNPPFVEYEVPKKWIKVNPSRVLSEQEKLRLQEHGRGHLRNFHV